MKPVEVLLVEDNAGDVLLVRQALAAEKFPIKVHLALDGKQAVQMLADRQFEPDVVILDLNIPKLSGLSVLECSQPGVPVVVFTSSDSPEDRQSALALGAKEFVQKPSDLQAYGETVCRVVRTWGAPHASAN